MIATLAGIDWRSFLARPPLPAASAHTLAQIARERILITGAGGSIGSALALRTAELAPRALILIENAEGALFGLQSSLGSQPAYVLGSVLDRSLLDEVFDRHRPSLVFHTAAYKHVPLLEEQPLAAIENNVFGTEAIVSAAAANQAGLILLSTDKAVEPASIMGATKRVAERIALAHGGTALRLGNVLASSGSVAEVFAAQIAAGRPMTVTDPAAKRYFLTLDEAVNLLLTAATALRGAHLLVPDLKSQHFVADLAQCMARTLAPGRDVAVAFTAPRSGDKESEKLWGADERAESGDASGLLSIHTRLGDGYELRRGLESLHEAVLARNVPAALAALHALVPEFTPSATVAAPAEHDASRATP